LNLSSDILVSKFAFKINSCRYIEGIPDLPAEKKPPAGSLSEPGEEAAPAGEPTKAKRARPRKPPAPAKAVEEEDDGPAQKAMRGGAGNDEQGGSLEDAGVGLGSTIIAPVVGTLDEDDDYDDL
jgi:hypothetical protein